MTENLKETTELVRKVLLIMANRENPFQLYSVIKLSGEIKKTQDYTSDLLHYMNKCRLLEGSKTTPMLTPSGLQLAQDISDDALWNEAFAMCEANKVYSMDTVVYSLRVIVKKRIQAEVNK